MSGCSVSVPARSDRGGGAPQWVLPEDGIVDPIAVEIAASGARRVALTHTERLLAAAMILAAGHHPNEVAERLHVSGQTGRRLVTQVRLLGLRQVPDLWALAYPAGEATGTAA